MKKCKRKPNEKSAVFPGLSSAHLKFLRRKGERETKRNRKGRGKADQIIVVFIQVKFLFIVFEVKFLRLDEVV